jgi:acyl-CoA synthetase (AMP-forming)/AMP-acid ligase II/acyl carrier protein
MITHLHGLLDYCARTFPEATAIMAPGRKGLTYRHLFADLEKNVVALSGMGIGRNDRVAIVLPNGPEMATIFLTVTACATSAPLNPSYRAEEFDFYLSDLKAKALITKSGLDSPAVAAANKRNIPVIELITQEGNDAGLFDLKSPAACRTGQVEYARPEDIALVLYTSGTTSRPKIVPLSQANICSSARNIRKSLELSSQDRCLNIMPLFHVHGLMAALLASITAGGAIVCTPGFVAPQFFAWMQECRPTWYTAVPTMHLSILERAAENRDVIAESSLRLIRSCSSSLSPKIMMELENVFHVPVIEAYGMTEASHQIASNPLPSARRKPGSVGFASGTSISIMTDSGAMAPQGQSGEIVIRGENVIHNYEDNPVANETAFSGGWFHTGDQGYLDKEGYLFITARIKEIINRGGEKISPCEIDEILLEHPEVSQAITFAAPDPKLGEEVAAAVVPAPNASLSERDLQEFVAAHLADFKVPRRILFIQEIPKGPTGKPQRIGLAGILGVSFADKPSLEGPTVYQGPRTELERLLVQIWGEVLGHRQIGITQPFIELGGDSILATKIVSRLGEALQVELTILDFFRSPTIETMALVIEAKLLESIEVEDNRLLEKIEEKSP